jgi:hypothetical protein
MISKAKALGLVCAFAVVAGIGPRAEASTAFGKIVFFEITPTSSVVRVDVGNSVVSGRPSCHHISFPTSYALDLGTNKGRALFSTLQAALLSSRQITVGGGSTCLGIGGSLNVEALQSLSISP